MVSLWPLIWGSGVKAPARCSQPPLAACFRTMTTPCPKPPDWEQVLLSVAPLISLSSQTLTLLCLCFKL